MGVAVSKVRPAPLPEDDETRRGVVAALDAAARQLGLEHPSQDLTACIWRLLTEAAVTGKRVSVPGPHGFPALAIEVMLDPWERFATEREWAREPDTKPELRVVQNPSRAAVSRFLPAMSLLREVGSKNPPRLVTLMVALAAGESPTRLAEIYGYRSRHGVHAAKYTALENIAAAVRQKFLFA